MILLIYILFIFFGFLWRSVYRNPNASPILTISLLVYFILWNFFPVLYASLCPDRTSNIISNDTYKELIINHLISIFIIIALFNILSKSKKQMLLLRHFKEIISPNFTLILLSIVLILVLFGHLYTISIVGSTFIERIEFAVSDVNKESSLLTFFNLFISIGVPFGVACFLSNLSNELQKYWIIILSLGIVCTDLVFRLLIGQRAALLMPLVMLIMYYRIRARNINQLSKLGILTILMILVFLSPFISIWIREIRSSKFYNIHDLIMASKVKIAGSPTETGLIFVDDWYTKFDSFQTGAILLDSEGKSVAGISLIISALTSPIPRILFPEKPVPFSIDGEYSGVPYYIVPYKLGIISASAVMPVNPSAIALWELGYLGLLIMIIINVVNLVFINIALSSKSIIYRTLGLLMIFLPTFEFLIAPTGWIIKEGVRILVLIFFVKLLFLIGSPKRRVLGIQNLTRNQKAFIDRTLH